MKKTLLYVAPNHIDFYKVIQFGFENYSDYEVTLLLSTYQYKYKNFGEKILNFIMKLLLNKNLKKIKFNQYYAEQLTNYKKFDVLFINRADVFTKEILEILSTKANYSIINYWDSFDKLQGQKETIKYFDKCYSFDKNDCLKYNLNFYNNFYYITDSTKIPEFDVFFLGTFDNRFNELKSILNKLSDNNIKVQAKVFSINKKIIKQNSCKKITFFQNQVPFPESYIYNKNTRIILDIAHENQIGLSFRPFEALGLKKKLITTNVHIEKYDFYNSNNIFIWRKNTENIPSWFLETPYQDVTEEIYQKYSLQNWISSILPK